MNIEMTRVNMKVQSNQFKDMFFLRRIEFNLDTYYTFFIWLVVLSHFLYIQNI